jgi:hypothetical protein
MPSVKPQFAEPPGGLAAHVPALCPVAMLQTPAQQSPFFMHMSPLWPHHEDGWHVPLAQRPEQQSALALQVLPKVWQPPLPSGAHVPFVHVWLQHSAFELHGWLSAVHIG